VTLRLSDKTISAIAQLVQVGILTGTDIIDNLRTLRLESDGEFLNPTEAFAESFNKGINDLLSRVEEVSDVEN